MFGNWPGVLSARDPVAFAGRLHRCLIEHSYLRLTECDVVAALTVGLWTRGGRNIRYPRERPPQDLAESENDNVNF